MLKLLGNPKYSRKYFFGLKLPLLAKRLYPPLLSTPMFELVLFEVNSPDSTSKATLFPILPDVLSNALKTNNSFKVSIVGLADPSLSSIPRTISNKPSLELPDDILWRVAEGVLPVIPEPTKE